MQRKDVPCFVADCSVLVEVLRQAKVDGSHGRGLLDDLVEQIEETRRMVVDGESVKEIVE